MPRLVFGHGLQLNGEEGVVESRLRLRVSARL